MESLEQEDGRRRRRSYDEAFKHDAPEAAVALVLACGSGGVRCVFHRGTSCEAETLSKADECSARAGPYNPRHVRISLNAGAFGPGDYMVQLDGLNMRREGLPVAWFRFSVTR